MTKPTLLHHHNLNYSRHFASPYLAVAWFGSMRHSFVFLVSTMHGLQTIRTHVNRLMFRCFVCPWLVQACSYFIVIFSVFSLASVRLRLADNFKCSKPVIIIYVQVDQQFFCTHIFCSLFNKYSAPFYIFVFNCFLFFSLSSTFLKTVLSDYWILLTKPVNKYIWNSNYQGHPW